MTWSPHHFLAEVRIYVGTGRRIFVGTLRDYRKQSSISYRVDQFLVITGGGWLNLELTFGMGHYNYLKKQSRGMLKLQQKSDIARVGAKSDSGTYLGP